MDKDDQVNFELSSLFSSIVEESLLNKRKDEQILPVKRRKVNPKRKNVIQNKVIHVTSDNIRAKRVVRRIRRKFFTIFQSALQELMLETN